MEARHMFTAGFITGAMKRVLLLAIMVAVLCTACSRKRMITLVAHEPVRWPSDKVIYMRDDDGNDIATLGAGTKCRVLGTNKRALGYSPPGEVNSYRKVECEGIVGYVPEIQIRWED